MHPILLIFPLFFGILQGYRPLQQPCALRGAPFLERILTFLTKISHILLIRVTFYPILLISYPIFALFWVFLPIFPLKWWQMCVLCPGSRPCVSDMCSSPVRCPSGSSSIARTYHSHITNHLPIAHAFSPFCLILSSFLSFLLIFLHIFGNIHSAGGRGPR